jgi:dienelactone hydrolase
MATAWNGGIGFWRLLAAVCLMVMASCPVDAKTVGMRSFLVTDAARRDSIAPKYPRQWMVDVYYPAVPGKAVPAPYLSDAVLAEHLAAGDYYGQPAAAVRAWQHRPGPAIADAVQSAGAPPLITIAPGLGIARANYAYLAAALVQRGFAVAVIDLPYLGIQRLPDGRMLDAANDPLASSDDPMAYAPRLREFARDVSVTLDRLSGHVRFDAARITVTGHSSGGTVAVDVCRHDARVAACADLEGGIEATEVARQGATKPTLIGASRAGGRPERAGGVDVMASMRESLGVTGGASGWVVKITGGSHMSYSDAPRVMPDTITRFGGETISADRSMTLYPGLIAAFAKAYTRGGGGDAAFEAFLHGQPEITRVLRSGPVAAPVAGPVAGLSAG